MMTRLGIHKRNGYMRDVLCKCDIVPGSVPLAVLSL